MHEDTRRRLLRGAFVLCCVLPTVGLLAWSLVRALPLQARRLERSLGDQLGIDVQLTRLSYPRPHVLVLHGVQLRNRESERLIARLGDIHATNSPAGWQLRLSRVEAEAEELGTLWRVLHDRLLPARSLDHDLAQVTCQQLALDLDGQPLSLHRLGWTRADDPSAHHSFLEFHLEDQAEGPPISVRLVRHREQRSHRTQVVLDTSSQQLPTRLLSTLVNRPSRLPSRMRGRLTITWEPSPWHAEFRGQLMDIPLSSLASDWVPCAVGGDAQLEIEHAAFDASGLTSARGHVSVQDFRLARPLMEMFLRLEFLARGPAYDLATSAAQFAAPQLDLDFWISELGLICKGPLDTGGLRVAAADDRGVLLLCDGFLPANHFVWALVPGTDSAAFQLAARWQRLLPATVPRVVK